MPAQMGYPDEGCQSCGAKAKGSSHGQSGYASGATAQGDSPLKDEYVKYNSQPAEQENTETRFKG